MAVVSFVFSFSVFFLFLTATGNPDLFGRPLFSFPRVEDDGTDTGLSLFGDARVSRDDSTIQITNGSSLSSGTVLYKIPVRMFQGRGRIPLSFFSAFSFAMSPGNGGRMSFAFARRGLPFELAIARNGGFAGVMEKAFVVEFDTLGGLLSIRVPENPRVGLVANSGDRLHCFIEYDSSSRVTNVWMGNSTDFRRLNPVVSCSTDLSKIPEKEMFVGIGASSSNASQIATLYSWSFRTRYSPFTLHSEPVDPREMPAFSKEVTPRKNSNAESEMPGSSLFLAAAASCGVIVAVLLLMLHLWFAKKSSAIQRFKTELAPHRSDFGYEKINAAIPSF